MFWSYSPRQGRLAKEKVDLGPKTEETQGPGGGVEKMNIKRDKVEELTRSWRDGKWVWI